MHSGGPGPIIGRREGSPQSKTEDWSIKLRTSGVNVVRLRGRSDNRGNVSSEHREGKGSNDAGVGLRVNSRWNKTNGTKTVPTRAGRQDPRVGVWSARGVRGWRMGLVGGAD